MAKHRVYLIPGFFGFTHMGEKPAERIVYFGHVRDVLLEGFQKRGHTAEVESVTGHPTASLEVRARLILRTIEERDIRFVRLWFTDVLGTLKSVAIAPAELEGAFTEGIGFDGSAIEGFTRVYEADMLAKPDPSTFQVLPWRGEG